MKTEERLGQALKELMSKEPLDQISVKRLSEICHINRQTFYYHFRDIYDLLTWIFLNETLKVKETSGNYIDSVYAFFEYIENNKVFVENVVSSAGRDLFIEFLGNNLHTYFLRALSIKDTENVLTNEDKRFVARFYCAAIIYVFINWIDQGMKDKKEDLISRLQIISDNQIEESINRFKKAKKGQK